MEARHLSPRTVQAYTAWIVRYIRYHGTRHPGKMGEAEFVAYLTYLASERRVARSTQMQALSALTLLYRDELGVPLPDLRCVLRSNAPRHLPAVLSREEVRAVLARLEGTTRLIALGKGGKDRVTMLPEIARAGLEGHLGRVRASHARDLREGAGSVELPTALVRKAPAWAVDLAWQWVFPASRRYRDSESGVARRHHVLETVMQRAMQQAVRAAGIAKRATCHTLRHSFAAYLQEDGYDIRTLQELLGHTDVSTTMIFTRVLNRGGLGVRSPADRLGGG